LSFSYMGAIFSFVRAAVDHNFPPAPTWSTKDIPDLTGKVALVTGGNNGAFSSNRTAHPYADKPFSRYRQRNCKGALMNSAGTQAGFLTTLKALLEHNAKVYIAARNSEKAEAAIKDLKSQTGREAHFLRLDLADLYSVRAAAEEFTKCALISLQCRSVNNPVPGRKPNCIFSLIMGKLFVCQ
jgi:retinol dehydrogenase 12